MNPADLTKQIISNLVLQTGRLSFSSLRQFAISPAAFMRYKLGQVEVTEAMIMGQVVHCLVLEPDSFEDRYFAADDTEVLKLIGGASPRSTAIYKGWKRGVMENAAGREIVKPADVAPARAIAAAINRNRSARWILERAQSREVPLDWPFGNFRFVGFADAVDIGFLAADLKIVQDADPRKFQRDVVAKLLYLQAAMYCEALGQDQFFFIAADRTGGVSVHRIAPKLLDAGRVLYANLVDRFADCCLDNAFDQSFDYWADRFTGIFELDRPNFLNSPL